MRVQKSTRDVIEVLVGYILILATVWTPNPAQRILFWISFIVIIGFCVLEFLNGERLGLGIKGMLGSLWAVGVAGVLAVTAIELAERFHTLHPFFGRSLMGTHAWGYLVWSFLQQLILQVFILSRLLRVFQDRYKAVLITAAMFAFAHAPNAVLVVATLAWGIAACALFLRYRNLYTVGIIHFILGVAIAVSVPGPVHHNMRVGLGYYFYRSHGPQRVADSVSEHVIPDRVRR